MASCPTPNQPAGNGTAESNERDALYDAYKAAREACANDPTVANEARQATALTEMLTGHPFADSTTVTCRLGGEGGGEGEGEGEGEGGGEGEGEGEGEGSGGAVAADVRTFRVSTRAWRKHVQGLRRGLGSKVDGARAAFKAATQACNAAKKAVQWAVSKLGKAGATLGGAGEADACAELERLKLVAREKSQEAAAANVRFEEAQAAFRATAKASITDDGAYGGRPELQDVLSRGCHDVTFRDAAGNVIRRVPFLGLCKFGGLRPTDEDEDGDEGTAGGGGADNGGVVADAGDEGTAGAQQQATLQLPPGTVWLDVLEKANGENAKFKLVRVDGAYHLLFGSKNVCRVIRLDASADEVLALLGTARDPEQQVWQTVGHVALAFVKTLTPEQLDLLVDVTVVGELMRPWAEHLVRAHYGIECFAVSNNGRAVDPEATWVLFAKLGLLSPRSTGSGTDVAQMRCVGRTRRPAADLLRIVADVEALTGSEGVVVYAVGPGPVGTAPVLGMFKVKTVQYGVRRRTREMIKTMLARLCPPRGRNVGPASTGGKAKAGDDPEQQEQQQQQQQQRKDEMSAVVASTKERLRKGMRELTHLPRCAERCGSWSDWACAFLDYLVLRFSAGGVSVADVSAGVSRMRDAMRGTFATLLQEFAEEVDAPQPR
jgi:hypothetical protein